MYSQTAKCPSCKNAIIEDHLLVPDRFHGRRKAFALVRCPKCSLVWIANPPNIDELAQHYTPEYDRSIAAGKKRPDQWRSRKRTLLEFKKQGAILDLGCGTGSFLKALESKDWKLYGIEMSAESAQIAQAESGAEVHIGDILDAKYEPSSFDVITCFHVFEHLYQPHAVLSKIVDWIKPDGIFYMMVPNIESAGAHIYRSYWYALEVPRHVFHYSPKSLITMARSVGFDVLSIKTYREVFIEQSTRYLIDDLLWRMGIRRTPLAFTQELSILFRIIRKAFRLTMLPVLTGLASLAGDGESIHAVLKKKLC